MRRALSDCLMLPEDPATALRAAYGVAPDAPFRVAYLPGPGDVERSFEHWREGRNDPRVPIYAYSVMFYELMARLGADAQVFTIHERADAPARADGVRFERVVRRPFRGAASYYWSEARYMAAVLPRIRGFRPHVVIASTDFPPAAWPALRAMAPLVLSAHNTFWPMHSPDGLKSRLLRVALAPLARSLSAAVCVSDECARQVARLGPAALPRFVPVPQVETRHGDRERRDARNLLYVGRIEDSKGVFLLLDAFRRIAAGRPEARLTFAGSGAADAALRARLAEDDLGGRIAFVGRLAAEAVHRALDEADLLVCPTMSSFNEGLAVVGFEAAAHGVPSVLSTVVPARERLGPGCAVFPADDGAALAATLDRLIGDPEAYAALRAGVATARASVYDRNLSWGSTVYRALLAAAPAHPA